MPLPLLYNAYNLPNIVDDPLPPAVAKVVAAEVKCVDRKPKQLRLLPQKWVSPQTKARLNLNIEGRVNVFNENVLIENIRHGYRLAVKETKVKNIFQVYSCAENDSKHRWKTLDTLDVRLGIASAKAEWLTIDLMARDPED